MSRFGGGPNPEMEAVREMLQDFTDNQVVPEGGWRIEASMTHSPVPWAKGLVTTDMQMLDHVHDGPFAFQSELLLLEIGYRATFALICETSDGYMSRFVRDLRRQCETEGHDWHDWGPDSDTSDGWKAYAARVGFRFHCPRCGHTDSGNCRCSFCLKGLRAVK